MHCLKLPVSCICQYACALHYLCMHAAGQSKHVMLCPGADINSLGFVFLQPVTASVLGDLTYQGVPAAQVNLAALTCDGLHIPQI